MSQAVKNPQRNIRNIAIGAACVAVLALAAWYSFGGSSVQTGEAATFTAKRGPLEILVTEGGSVQALESLEIKSEVRGQTRILSLVEEGYEVTLQDVEDGKILIELDKTDLLDAQTRQELEYQNALADFTESQEQFEIQRNQNESDIKEAELAVRFARLDLEKYLGENVAQDLVVLSRESDNLIDEEPLAASAEKEEVPEPALTDGDVGPQFQIELETKPYVPVVDFRTLADPSKLGDGEAKQELRKLDDDLVLAEEEVNVAENQLDGTQRLFEKEFVTRTELESDTLSLQRKEIALDAAKTARNLFISYEFPKQAEKLLSDYDEALRSLERTKRSAVARLSQAEGKLRSAEARYQLQTREREEIQEQIDKTVIRATKPGLVVYGDGDNDLATANRDRSNVSVLLNAGGS